MANEDSTSSGPLDEVMTSVGGIRVRKDEQEAFEARHKAVLAPRGGSAASKPKAARGRKAASGADGS